MRIRSRYLATLRFPVSAAAVSNPADRTLRVVARRNNLHRVDAAFRVEKSPKTRRVPRFRVGS
jgi:hypothetical protein